MSPEIQNRGTSGAQIGHVNVSAKKKSFKKKTRNKNNDFIPRLYITSLHRPHWKQLLAMEMHRCGNMLNQKAQC